MTRPAALAACALLAAGCFHTHHVSREGGDEGASRGGEREHAQGGDQGGKKEQGPSPRPSHARVPPRGDRPAVAASPEGLMNPGAIREIQAALRDQGYLREPSGELDEATSAALRRFQRDQALPETGAPDRETLRLLGVDAQRVYRTGTGR